MSIARLVLGLVLLSGPLPATAAAGSDILLLLDGRILEGLTMDRVEGGVLVSFQNGDVMIRDELILDVIIESGDGYQPRSPEEEEKVAQGLVPFEGKWIKTDRRDRLVAQRISARRQAVEDMQKHSSWRHRNIEKTKHFQFEHTLPPPSLRAFS